MKNNIFALLALITFGSSLAMHAPEGTPIRIMTFNIRRLGKEKDEKNLWQNRQGRVVELIKSLHPDIMGLQEPTVEQITDLKNALNMPSFGAGRGKSWLGMGPDEYNAIFYNSKRLGLEESGTFAINPSTKLEYAWDPKKYGLLPRICTWGKFKDKSSNQEFFVFNTHLDHLYATAQVHGLTTILQFIESIPKNLPLILMGDFNTEITPELQSSTLKDFINTKALAREVVGPDETRTGWRHEELKKIDHILVRNNAPVGVLRHLTIQEPCKDTLPSDHRPVMVDLVFVK